MYRVEKEFIQKLVEKFCSPSHEWTDDELDNFYYENEKGGFTACVNIDGDCFIEDFNHIESVHEYLEGNLDIAEIYSLDKRRDHQMQFDFIDEEEEE